MNENHDELPLPPSFEVVVTQELIDQAIPANSGHCMASDAIKPAYFKKFKRQPFAVSTDLQTIRLTDKDKGCRYIYLTPPVVQRALLQFDQKLKVTPFKFKLKRNGAQTIRTVRNRKSEKPLSEAQIKQRQDATKRSVVLARRKRGVKLHTTDSGRTKRSTTKLGGKAPPIAVLSGNRRQYGIKAAGVLEGPTQ